MYYTLYTIATTLALPVAAVLVALGGKHRATLRNRLKPPVPASESQPVWIHACSVGEVRTAEPFLKALSREWPQVPLVLTVSTATGHAVALEMKLPAALTWLPLDHPLIMRRFVRALRPRLLAIVETELWPALLRETTVANTPIAIINGRLSDRHFQRYERDPGFIRAFMPRITAVCAQSEAYAEKFRKLGTPPGVTDVVGNSKFDGAPDPDASLDSDALRAECAIDPAAPVLVFGSTRPGDELRALRGWRELRKSSESLRLVIAPRHPNRVDEIRKHIEEPVHLMSRMHKRIHTSDEFIIIVDTFGQLNRFYALATLAVIGGSFDPDIQGHNPIEPAALGVPVVFGPHMKNFADPARLLVDADAAIQVNDDDALHNALRNLLGDESKRRSMGEAGQAIVRNNRGAVARTIEILRPHIVGHTQDV